VPARRRGRDPALTTRAWERDKAWWRNQGLPCQICGIPLDYRKPRGWHLGHIVGRHQARRMGWTEEQIAARSNQRPECVRCSTRAGARYGNRVRGAVARGVVWSSSRW